MDKQDHSQIQDILQVEDQVEIILHQVQQLVELVVVEQVEVDVHHTLQLVQEQLILAVVVAVLQGQPHPQQMVEQVALV
jgi:hypothetical protein